MPWRILPRQTTGRLDGPDAVELLKRIYLTSPSHNCPGGAIRAAVAAALSPWGSWNSLRQYDRHRAVRPGPDQSQSVWRQVRAQGWHPASPTSGTRKNITFCARGWSAAACPSLRFPTRYRVGGQRHRLQERRQTPLHPAGGLARRSTGTVDHTDRPTTGGGWGELVCPGWGELVCPAFVWIELGTPIGSQQSQSPSQDTVSPARLPLPPAGKDRQRVRRRPSRA